MRGPDGMQGDGPPPEAGRYGAGPGSWTFLTNHMHVLLCIAEDPSIRLRDIAGLVGITERATQSIVADLVESGYLSRHRVGRRNHYQVHRGLPLRHPLEQHRSVNALIDLLREPGGNGRRRAADPPTLGSPTSPRSGAGV